MKEEAAFIRKLTDKDSRSADLKEDIEKPSWISSCHGVANFT